MQATILIVDDEPAVLSLVARILRGGGFEVLPGSSPSQALRIEREFDGHIHLLLSDVAMPEMTGPDLASALKQRRPAMRVLLMSGYADGATQALNDGWHFLPKPFLPQTLLTKVKGVLDEEQ